MIHNTFFQSAFLVVWVEHRAAKQPPLQVILHNGDITNKAYINKLAHQNWTTQLSNSLSPYLHVYIAVTPVFYLLPKIHKNLVKPNQNHLI